MSRNTVNEGSALGAAERMRRLATSAITRDNPRALRRHLDSGLDPQALTCLGYGLGDGDSLLEMAAGWDRLECFHTLVAAGAEVTSQAIRNAMGASERCAVLKHMLNARLLDPAGDYCPGASWVDEAARASAPAGLMLTVAKSEKERADLQLLVGAPKALSRPMPRL